MIRLFLCLALGLSGCKSSETRKQDSSEDASAANAASEASDGASAPEDEAALKEAITATLEAVPEIQKQVAEIRGLPFKTDVPAAYQSQEDFRSFVTKQIRTELPPDKSADYTRALHRLGLLKSADRDLALMLEDAFVSQAGAYYDPGQKKFFVVMVSTNALERNTITAHELTHALQDQYFDLKRYYGETGGKTKLSEDEANARRFIVEGEATLLMLVQAGKAMANMNMLEPGPAQKALGSQLDGFANMEIEQLVAMTRAQAASYAGNSELIKKALESLDTIPLYILVPLLDSYMKGTLPVFAAYRAGGWKAVGKLYEKPPTSTEQVLHPEEKLVGKRDEPVHLSVGTWSEWKEIHSETIGELGWRVYFMLWKAEDPKAAAAGWDGDRVAVFEEPGGKLVALVATAWDSPAEAQAFEKAYRTSLTARYGEGGGEAQVERRGNKVYVVDGSSDPKHMGKLIRGR